MKKRTSRLLSVLLTLVMVLGLLPALGTTAAAKEYEPIVLELESGENVFDSTKVQDTIAEITGGRLRHPGKYRYFIYTADYDRSVYGKSYDPDIVSDDGLAKKSGGALLKVVHYNRESGKELSSFEVVVYVNSVTIDKVAVAGIDTPSTGQPLDITAECSTPGIESATVRWYTLGEDSKRVRVNSGAVAKAGTVYLAHVSVTPAIGYDLAGLDNITVTVNGAKATPLDSGNRNVDVTYQFPATGGENYENQNWVTTKKIISEVAVTGVVTPVDGAKPVETCELGGMGYTLKSMSWYDGSLKMNSAGTFQAGKTYQTRFYLLPEKGYTFNDADSMTATVNGKTVEVTNVYGEPEQRGVTIDFTCEKPSKTISTVAVTGIDAPVIGATPDTTAAASPGMTVGRVTWSPADPVFKEGVAYTVTVTVLEEDGYTFGSAVTATINGQTAKYSRTRQAAKLFVSTVSYTFPALKAGAPAITTQPKSVSVKEGADVTFSVAATGEALNYQWYQEKGGSTSKVGTNGPTYTIKAVNVSDDNGTAYYCVVSNKVGEVTSNKATLTVSKLGTMTTFSDIPEGAYYTDAVAWAVEKGVTSGTSGTTFSPNADCTRAQIVTFLWRAAGSPAPKSKESSFTDVAADAYYSDAVRWAVENGITSGTSSTTFSPNATCTRAQTVTFLWRSQKSPADGTANAFTDVADGTYYIDAVKWAVKNGITSGTSANTFSPNADCSRAQIVTFLYRCMGK